MQKAVSVVADNLNTMRTGRANPAILDRSSQQPVMEPAKSLSASACHLSYPYFINTLYQTPELLSICHLTPALPTPPGRLLRRPNAPQEPRLHRCA